MVDAMEVLGAAASAKLAGDRLVRDFVAYIRSTSTSISAAAQTYAAPTRHTRPRRNRKARLSRPMKPSIASSSRRSSARHSKKVSTMTDAELEAELDTRRRRRARERDMYTRAMRSDKLAALEHELDSLRRELGRIDPAPDRPAGTPPNARWEPLPRARRSAMPALPLSHNASQAPLHQPPTPAPPQRAGGPPPPPPPPPMGLRAPGDEDGDDPVDPERQRKEKLERQKRREAKKKEREQTQKKMTLADIIRSAGPDPIRKLKPASLKPADAEKEAWERAKREREEREARQEKERLEKERLAKEGSKRAAEKVAAVEEDGESSVMQEKVETENKGQEQRGEDNAEGGEKQKKIEAREGRNSEEGLEGKGGKDDETKEKRKEKDDEGLPGQHKEVPMGNPDNNKDAVQSEEERGKPVGNGEGAPDQKSVDKVDSKEASKNNNADIAVRSTRDMMGKDEADAKSSAAQDLSVESGSNTKLMELRKSPALPSDKPLDPGFDKGNENVAPNAKSVVAEKGTKKPESPNKKAEAKAAPASQGKS